MVYISIVNRRLSIIGETIDFGLVERKYDIYVAKGLDKYIEVCYNDFSRSKTNKFTTFKYCQCKERGIANKHLL